MASNYEVTFTDVVLSKSSSNKSAIDFLKTLNKDNLIIKSIKQFVKLYY